MFRLSVIATNATYQLSSSTVSVDEGNQVTITLNTTGVQNGQALPYTISGTGITTDDFVALPSLSGNFTVQNNNAIAILTTAADDTTEGPETFNVALENGHSVAVDVNDTSIDVPTYPSNLWRTLNNPNAYGTSAEDQFGYSVAISGNYAIVGAYYEGDAGGLGSGKAYIFN